MKEGLFDDTGTDWSNIPWQMCMNCRSSEKHFDEHDHEYYKCLLGAKYLDDCEYQEKIK